MNTKANLKRLLIIALLSACATAFASETVRPLLAQLEPVKPVEMKTAQPRMMGLYEQGFSEGANAGNQNAGKIGWFFAGFGNLPLMWLPWIVEPRRPAEPSILAEEEFNKGFKSGYRAGWKNAHKTYYITGAIVESAIVGGILIAKKAR